MLLSTSLICRRLALLTLLLSWASVAAAQAPQHIRVRLFERQRPAEATLEAQAPLTLYAGDYDTPIARLQTGETATLSVRGEDVHVSTGAMNFFARALRVVPAETGRWTLAVTKGRATPDARTYTGVLHVAPAGADRLRLINDAPIQDYVAGVVASEYGLGDLAGAKAMAVAARTYAFRDAATSETAYDQTDHTGSQVYRGVGPITPTARRAARTTRGEVLTYDGALIEAVYFSSSGGHTADNDDVWDGRPLPYLRGKSDPYDDSPYQHWRTTIDRSRLLDRLSARYGFDVRGFVISARSEDGRVNTVELLGPNGRRTQMQANAFRLFANAQTGGTIRSTFFDAARRGDRYVFEGRGFGHGVGMSQYGAHEMAQQGYGYRDILHFYYTDVHLTTLDGLPAPLPQPDRAVAERLREPAPPAPKTPRRRIGW